MSDALEHVRYSCGIAGEEVANYVDQLQATVAELEAEVERLSVAHVKACQANADSQAELAKAEQRIAEACALACEDVIGNTANDQRMIAAIDCSAMIRSGEWRKFVKEV